MRDDAWLQQQQHTQWIPLNLIDSEVDLTMHCELLKGLMDYLEFLYSNKGNTSRVYVCKSFYCVEKRGLICDGIFHGLLELLWGTDVDCYYSWKYSHWLHKDNIATSWFVHKGVDQNSNWLLL